MSQKLAAARYIFKKSQRSRSVAYCKCAQEADFLGNVVLDNCVCGEDESSTLNWQWNNEVPVPEIKIEENNVTFHPIYSQGTACVKGNKALDKQMIHYWEIKIVSSMSGTDLVRMLTFK